MIREVSPDVVVHAALIGATELEIARQDGGANQRWWLHRRVLPDGRVLYLWEMLGNNLRISLSQDVHDLGFHANYCFHDWQEAWRNAIGWDGEGDPEGWVRHIETGRRRPDGEPEREYIRP